jgi:pimeloyl-ACP methyl ester carboxylesterase
MTMTAMVAMIALFGWGSMSAADDVRTLKLSDGSDLAYVDRGSGDPALVLVHCGNCQMGMWKETIEAFAPSNRVVAMDLPGHGRSGWKPGRMTIEGRWRSWPTR